MPLYREAVKELLETHATDDIIAETSANMLQFTQLSNKAPKKNVGALRDKAFRCNMVYNEYVLKVILIVGLSESIHHSMHSFGVQKTTLQYMICRATQLC